MQNIHKYVKRQNTQYKIKVHILKILTFSATERLKDITRYTDKIHVHNNNIGQQPNIVSIILIVY